MQADISRVHERCSFTRVSLGTNSDEPHGKDHGGTERTIEGTAPEPGNTHSSEDTSFL